MNPSSSPANNTNSVAYGHLLAEASKLKRADQINLVRALAGQLGMIAQFPGQLLAQAGAGSSTGAKAPKDKKEKGPAKRAPSNPLAGTPEKKSFDEAKKAVNKATKTAGGQKLPEDHELVLALNKAKDQYFRSLSEAKGEKTEEPSGSSSKGKERA